ncbi:MAG: Hsp70 family protein [Planctomycetales bacterium]|nr:Hsp70 family protein [Planctomycetales bacterium]
MTIGIDLGTTNSVCVSVDEDGKVIVHCNDDGKRVTPSVVFFDGPRTVVGAEAKEAQRVGEPDVASFFKRSMGEPGFRFVRSNGDEKSAIELSACVLRQLKADAERELGHPVTDAVITVPAYFHDDERKATKAAGELAGLNVLQLINEPTAAAIAYGLSKPTSGERTVMVYDLGGGTFDVTLLRLTAEETRVLTSEGDAELGGKDWDARVVDFLAAEFSSEFGSDPLEDSVAIGDLWVAAEDAKKTLTDRKVAKVIISHDGDKGRYELTREQFDQLCSDLVDRTFVLVNDVLQTQHLTVDDVDEVLLVGGSTRMPMIIEALEKKFKKPPAHGVNVDEAVAIGAAMCARGHCQSETPSGLAALGPGKTTSGALCLGGVTITDVTPHSLGMIAINEDESAYINSIILPKDLSIPRLESRPYQHFTRPGDNNPLEVFMTQGEQERPDQVKYLGRYLVPKVPHDPRGTVVVIDYAYDLSGSVQVTARLADTNENLEVKVESLPEDVPARFMGKPESSAIGHVTVYLAFDLSGSMSGQPLAEAKKAALAFLQQIDLSHCSVGVLVVADRTLMVVEACQNASKISSAIGGLATGMNGIGYGNADDPFEDAMELLKDVAGPRFVITLADGVWEQQSRAITRAKALHQAEIDVIAIGFGGADKKFLREIASCEEGSFFTTLSGLSQTFSSIAQVLTKSRGGRGDVSMSLSESQAPDSKRKFWGLLASD